MIGRSVAQAFEGALEGGWHRYGAGSWAREMVQCAQPRTCRSRPIHKALYEPDLFRGSSCVAEAFDDVEKLVEVGDGEDGNGGLGARAVMEDSQMRPSRTLLLPTEAWSVQRPF